MSEQTLSNVYDALDITKEWANPDYGWTANERTIFNALRELKHELSAAKAQIELLRQENGMQLTKLVANQAQIAALKRGEYICKKCGLRKDGERENGGF